MSRLFSVIHPAEFAYLDGVPYSNQFQDIYYSTENAIEESNYVFLQSNQLVSRFKSLACGEYFVIGETGFGTGLNFIRAASCFLENTHVNTKLFYIATELHPFRKKDFSEFIKYYPGDSSLKLELAARYPSLTPGMHIIEFTRNDNISITLMLLLGDSTEQLQSLLTASSWQLTHETALLKVDAWFLDGFSPAKNSQMWQSKLFETIAFLSKPNITTLSTFSSAGIVKENLKTSGFEIKKQKGYGKKRDMVTAVYVNPLEKRLPIETPWAFPQKKSVNHNKTIAVIGAGLAGCVLARELAILGFQVSIYDSSSVASQASGNPYALLFPKLSAYRAPMTEFMLMGYLYALDYYQQLNIRGFCELVMLAKTQKEQKAQASLASWLLHYPEIAEILNDKEMSGKLQEDVLVPGLVMAKSLCVDSQALCLHLIDHQNITFRMKHINACDKLDEDIKIWATGIGLKNIDYFSYLPLEAITGQMTIVKDIKQFSHINFPVCGQGHITSARDGKRGIGASYHLKQSHYHTSSVDDLDNIKKVESLLNKSYPMHVLDSWGGVRAATTDYLPIVGAVLDIDKFNTVYAAFGKNAKAQISVALPRQENEYLFVGFGSRGLTTIPLAAKYLAHQIAGLPTVIPAHLIKAISPARFLKKKLADGQGAGTTKPSVADG